MKKTLLLFFSSAFPFFSNAQCSVITTSQGTSCYGSANGIAVATANGVPSFSYLWSPGNQTTLTVTGLTAGTYVVTMTDGVGCIATATVTISSPLPLNAVITSVSPSCGACCDGSATVLTSGGNPPYSYQWMPGNQIWPSISNLCAGTYSVCVTDAGGCSTCNPTNCQVCETSVTLSVQTGIPDDPLVLGKLSVYPTRVNQFVTLDESFENPTNVEISIANLLGQTVYINDLGSTIKLHNFVDLAGLPDGIYLISVITNSGAQVRKVIKE